MTILAIDPGPKDSGFVLWDGLRVRDHGHLANEALLDRIRCREFGGPFLTVIEQVESFGMAVGAEVFETVFWSGRFAQAAGSFDRLPRRAIKLHLCQSMRAKDSNIRQALIDRFGPPGTKKAPGLLYGITTHRIAALAVAVTYYDSLHKERIA